MLFRSVVCSGLLQCQHEFNEFIPLADRAYLHKPRMLKFRRDGITLLIFNNLKFRTMGGQGVDHEIIFQQHKDTLQQILTSFPWACQSLNMEITTMTFSIQVPNFINFHYLPEENFYVDTEMFPALAHRFVSRQRVCYRPRGCHRRENVFTRNDFSRPINCCPHPKLFDSQRNIN